MEDHETRRKGAVNDAKFKYRLAILVGFHG